ncbi:TIGR03617 family F420-dependent LLM class oxidoreductase [Halopseudomonas phragmitis]|uniref:LLM class F420-dependent oxidoreductase n=1 Tax=Halopseudomonas phragmitis TaxID=1931241 RepID=A0A1V0B9N6_9GAMM|nr:TIGR03617 family F420-dependent LLM class oxidoreductase [Halopseudomonas phragmitis]AQZ96494.1 LLM class F420-dependent oxidoreductase [Halopseudomonas phragmitis]
MLEVFASTPENLGLGDIGAFARRVEAMGYDGLFVSDAIHDGLLLAGQALASTSRLKVGTSVLIAFPRSPMNVALACWDLQSMSSGRFELGLGTQIKQNIEERYSARWLPPAAGMREYLEALRAIFHSFRTGERLNYEGEHFRFTRLQPFFNPGPINAPDVPLMLGAVGPKMLELVGSTADGIHTHPTNTSVRYLQEVIRPHINKGLAMRDPQLPPPVISASQFVATGPDAETVAGERERFRDMLAFLFSTPAYRASLELFGWEEIGEQLQQLTRANRWHDMPNILTDEILDTFLVSSDYAGLPDALVSRFNGLVDRVTLTVPGNPNHDEACAVAIAEIRRRAQTHA